MRSPTASSATARCSPGPSARSRRWPPKWWCPISAISRRPRRASPSASSASFTAGVLLALVAYRMRIVRDFVDPIISLLRTLPIVSFIIMLLIWVGPQNPTMFLAFFIVLPLIYTNVLSGFESVDPQMLEMARVFRSPWRTFMYVYRPR
ncbi:MAG: ABC transporter permease [Collinsella sp.]